MRDSENMISECISETIRKQLPVRNILKDFLNEVDEDINEADEAETDIKDPVNKKYLKKLETVVKKELKTTNTLSGIDIDLIRQVIREEMEGKPNTNIIKKELVDNVVEKIVEKSNELNEEFTNNTKVVDDTTKVVDDTTKVVHDLQKNKIKKAVNISNNIDIIPNAIENIIDIKNKNIDITTNEDETTKDETTKDETTKDETTKDKINKDEVNENINTSLDHILNDTENIITNTVDDIDADDADDANDADNANDLHIEDADNDDSINIIRDGSSETNSLDKNVDTKIKSQPELCINNIDEVNLNLDELDDNDCEEIDIDDLSSVNFNKKDTENSNELKKSENTKYIFFNDAK